MRGVPRRARQGDSGVDVIDGIGVEGGGTLSRELWQTDLVDREMLAIREELHCNAVGVYGTDLRTVLARPAERSL